MEKHFESLCGSKFWDPETVYSEYPDFTSCFQITLVLWGPCFVLWLVAPLWVYMLTRQNSGTLKTSWVFIAKNVSTIALVLIETLNITLAVINKKEEIYYLTPIFMILSYLLALGLTNYERVKGLRSSTLIFTFWSLLGLTTIITFRTKIIEIYTKKSNIEQYENLLFFSFYTFVILNLILSLFTEKYKESREKSDIEFSVLDSSHYHSQHKLKTLPENSVSLLSRLCFWWINDLIMTGFKRELTRNDLWKIEETEASDHLTQKLETAWNKASKKYIENLKNHTEENDADSKNKSAIYKTEAKNLEEEKKLTDTTLEVSYKNVKKIEKPSFGLCLCRVYAGKFLAGSFIKLIQDILLFVGPVILDKLLNFIKDKDQNTTIGLFYTLLLFLSSLIQSFVLQHYFHRMFIVGSRIKTSVTNLVYKKSLRLSTTARKMATVGEMTNLVAVNTQMFAELTTYLNIIWSAPFQITVSLFMLWRYLGVAALIGVGTIIFLIPLNILIGNKIKKIQLTKQKQQDSRIKMMNEILSGIKIIKFYGWEFSFKDLIEKIRSNELKFYKKMGFLSISSNFLWSCAPLVITIVSFGSFILLNDSEKFTANVVFVSLSLFNILRFPLTVLPSIISSMISAKVSLTRISTFLLREEINENDISYDDIPDVAVKTSNVDLGWDKNTALFKNLNLEIKKEKLIAVVGQVGQGKSSFLSGLLGEMHKLNEGMININGRTAYVPQQAWIQNETVKNNILFGSKFDEDYYRDVLKSCSLITDLKIMPAGDQTEIGEKGINLSGGQKQRISLARALYSNADIYMLDDPLSAVDSHVGKHIFDMVIGPNGILKNKTRIFVTNSLSFLPQVDEIIMLENGKIVEKGTFDQLKTKQGVFNDFIKNHLNKEVASTEETTSNEQNEAILDKKIDDKQNDTKLPSESTKSLNKQQSFKDNNQQEKAGEKIIVKEKIETGKVKFSVLVEYFRACGIVFVFSYLVLYSLTNMALVGSNVWLKVWTDKKINTTEPENRKYSNFLIFTAIGVIQCILSIISDLVFLYMYYDAAKSLHNSMLFSILRSTMEFFESTPTGRIINRFSKDIDAAERAIPESFKSLARCIFHVIFTVLVITYSTPFFLITLIPIIIVYVLVQRYFVASMRQLKRMESASKSPIFSHFSETLTGVTTIRAYRSQNRFIKIMQNHVDENLLFYFPNNISNRWLALRLELIGNLISVFASFFAVLSRNSISPGIVGLSITYSLNISQTLNWLVRMSAEFETNITSIERIKEYCETPHESEYINLDTKPKENWPDKGSVVFRDFSIKYRKELENVLNQINCVINPGEKIGIVGRTGAGKSSLTLSLFRILEYSTGKILIDDVDIKNIGLHDLRHKLTIIPQDPVIFSGSIRMNLDPFNSHDDDELWKALELADLKPFILGLDKNLDYECSEGGENLSVGQRQLICLARALLRKTKILILDEATASIDHNTDELIQKTIRSEFKDCTVLTIAHRLNTIMDSSRILVLEKGKIAEFDSPQNLLKNKNSKFYSMAKDAGLV